MYTVYLYMYMACTKHALFYSYCTVQMYCHVHVAYMLFLNALENLKKLYSPRAETCR